VHCPAEYNRLEIDDAVTGERLTSSENREPADVFHSRLAVSASGRYLLSAGWVWLPWGCVLVYDLHGALAKPENLDTLGDVIDLRGLTQWEVAGACFVEDDIVVSTSAEPEVNDPDEPDELAPNMLARWSIAERKFLWRKQLDQTAGDVVSMGDDVLSLYQHPRLYDGKTGELLEEWPDLPTGQADSAIVRDHAFSGPARVAIDHHNRRFAVTDGERVTVVYLDDQSRHNGHMS
jgi:hypothetical protein